MTDAMIAAAVEAREKSAFAPYSEYSVGAALDVGDEVIRGGNVELKPTVVGIHAEQYVVAKALERGYSDAEKVVIALEGNCQPPCGVCLQALASIDPDLEMTVGSYDVEADEYEEWTLEELLPGAYTPDVRHNDL